MKPEVELKDRTLQFSSSLQALSEIGMKPEMDRTGTDSVNDNGWDYLF